MTVGDVIHEMVAMMMESMDVTSASDDMKGTVINKLIRIKDDPSGMNQLLDMELKTLIKEVANERTEEAEAKAAHVKQWEQWSAGLGGFIGKDPQDQSKWDFGLKQNQVTKPIREGVRAATRPEDMGMMFLSKLPHAVLIMLAIQLAPMIIDELKRPGSFLDIRFKRLMLNEFNAFLQRQEQWNTQLGLRNLTVQNTPGFIVTGGTSATETTLRIVRGGGTIPDTRLATQNNQLTHHEKELFDD
jgi:hypothetical protein